MPAAMSASKESDWETSDSDAETSSSSSSDSEIIPPTCAHCDKTEADISNPLKPCSKCHTQRYCSRECQAADLKVHKYACGKNPAKDFLQGMGETDYLHQFSEEDAFHQLIDCYRLRIEDDYTFSGDAGGLYAEENPLPDFRRFLNLAEKRKGPLPEWWSAANRKKCERLATDRKQWSCLYFAVEKSDVMEHYKDNLMPMKLRMLAEKIYKRGLGLGGW